MELILDASVVLKWFLEEEQAEKALAYRQSHLSGEICLVATPLLAFEVSNALCTKSGVGREMLLSALEVFYLTGIEEYPFDGRLARETVVLARKYKVSVYDASYVALARFLGCQFVTADEKLYRRIKDFRFVELLE